MSVVDWDSTSLHKQKPPSLLNVEHRRRIMQPNSLESEPTIDDMDPKLLQIIDREVKKRVDESREVQNKRTPPRRMATTAQEFNLKTPANTHRRRTSKEKTKRRFNYDSESEATSSDSEESTDVENDQESGSEDEDTQEPYKYGATETPDKGKVEFKWLPAPGERGAPSVFSGPEDDAEEWLERFEAVSRRGRLNEEEKCEFLLDFASKKVKGIIRAQSGWKRRDWRRLRRELIQLFPYHTRSAKYSELDLKALVTTWANTAIEVDVQLEEYVRDFMEISDFLLDKGSIDKQERDFYFLSGFNRDLRLRIDHEIKWMKGDMRRYRKRRAYPFKRVLQAARSLFEQDRFDTLLGTGSSDRIKEYEKRRREEREVEKIREKERLAQLAKQPAAKKTIALPPIEAPRRREFQVAAETLLSMRLSPPTPDANPKPSSSRQPKLRS